MTLAVGLLLKLTRDFGIIPVLLPLDANGISPNVVIPLALPFVILIANRSVSLWGFTKTATGLAVGIIMYEVIQIWMPKRTFDLMDIYASFAGALASIIIAWVLFFRLTSEIKNETEPASRPYLDNARF
jgi:hypothetical protein